ncbi:MAG: DNA polymerase III subunit delta, partial [Bacteroidales bacterium]|nr:DNA polymerase III subunit delta [Bacteroidales bacterium]
MKFTEIIGQKVIVEKLLRSVSEERVSHAQIFAGPEGSGKLAIAIAFAQFISCENPTAYDSCGVCPSCIKYEKLAHPDLHFVFPVFKKGSKNDPLSNNFIEQWREQISETPYFNLNNWLKRIGVENEQGLIYASEAADIIKKLSLKSYESEYKAMIIWLPEKMHSATANKLLKLIEEPPEKTLFLLVSEDVNRVLPTILSRCQFVRVPAITQKELALAFSDRLDVPADKAMDLAHISTGNFVKGKNLITEDETRVLNMENFTKLMRSSWKKDIISLTEWADEIAITGRESQKRFLDFSIDQL